MDDTCHTPDRMTEIDLSTILDVMNQVGGVSGLDPDQDFYDAGFTSLNALPLLMELETRFSVSIPDDRFIAARTPRALQDMISDLKQA